jgi:polysaccharide biosynthesis/export protein
MTQLTKHYRSFCAVIFTKSLLLASSVIAQKAEPPQNPTELAAAADTAKPLNFRPPNASLNVNPSLESGAGISDLESLIDRRDSLEAEIRYSQNRMESDRKRVQVLQSLGQSEEADRLLTQVRDAEARIKTNRDQLVQIEDEVNRLQNNTSERGQGLTLGEEIILPGENLEVIVNEDAGFNNRYVVRRGGYIIMPGIGRVPVAGKTVIQAERDISQALKQTQLKRATVTVERFQGVNDESTVIYLAGEFRNPRPYRIPAGTSPTLISVLLSSGGWTDRADLTRVKIMRVAANKPVADEVNVKRILDGQIGAGGLGADITLTEGDVIVLPSGSLNLVYVTGRIKRPGSYRITEGEKLTVYGAVLQSGGFDHFASLSNTHILRAMPDGTKAKIPINIKEVQRGRKPDIILQPNDIIVVPEKWFSW